MRPPSRLQAIQRRHQRALARHREIDRLLQRAHGGAVQMAGREPDLVDEGNADEQQEHAFVEAGQEMTVPELRA